MSSCLPESCILILLGLVAGVVIHHTDNSGTFHLSPRLFMLFLLPPIVLDSAYSLNDKVFYQNLGTILLYAVVGTLLNWIFIGPTLYGLSQIKAMGDISLSLLECLLFSSFIVAVDPVAVLAIFQEIGVNKCLYFLVFGESLLNDAVTIVLSNTMSTFLSVGDVSANQIGLGIASFFTVSLGGLSIGIIFGVITSIITKHTLHVRVVEPLCMFGFAYLAYLVAEMVHWSGIISCIGCGLVQNSYAMFNISRKSRTTVKYFSKMLSSTMDAIIFLFLGIELYTIDHYWHSGFVLWSIFLCTIYRSISVFGLTFLANYWRENKINLEEQFIMFYGGLRGAVCFAIASTLTEGKTKSIFMTATFGVIIWTVFIQGLTIKPLVGFCKIKKMQSRQNYSLFQEMSENVFDSVLAGIEGITDEYGDTLLWMYLKYYDNRYCRPILQSKESETGPPLVKLYEKVTLKDSTTGFLKYTSSNPALEDAAKNTIRDVENGITTTRPSFKKMLKRAYSLDTGKTRHISVEGLGKILKSQSADRRYHDKNLTREGKQEQLKTHISTAQEDVQNWAKRKRLFSVSSSAQNEEQGDRGSEENDESFDKLQTSLFQSIEPIVEENVEEITVL
ncbi:DgyrCDS8845 [Dimorphilus gyrociliatus]|uniref:Sodium/hydrogen exchanger n=1 Tax=Dimorphilus gyrociliatus TaxID=2664684 RepID=A0A7I8VX31_9ANNE|nr:DgyrCDS8845 [Dimorphilus gyrociliatus]